MKKVIVFTVCLSLLFASLLAINCGAKEIENERVYKPLDLVVVIDTSGSMRYSDPNRTALDAVRMLVNMMPAKDSRVGIVGFNTDPTVLSEDASGNKALISLEDFTGVETIRSDVSTIVYNGGTGIGNAVKAATDLLNSKSDREHTKAIILFTDGVNDFGYNQIALSMCEENEVDAITWAEANDCAIYCVGYDYVTSSGVSSMGAGGEGLQKLQNIADSTGGICKAIQNISDIEQLLIEFLADVCDLIYKTVGTIPGDGGFHECVIPVSPSVIEANIRIAGGGINAIKDGKIRLYDPLGKEVQLVNAGSVRFDSDATAASIKVIMPKPGDWLLTVEGISGEDIHVGLLEHFKMNLKSQLVFPDGNPAGVAYTNDTIGISTWLTYDDAVIDNDEIYDAVTSATAVCVSRANPNDKKTINLTREGNAFVGSFTIPEDCVYDITIRIDWDTVYREDTLMVMSSNTPLKAVKDIEDVNVNKGKTVTLDSIYQYVYDEENDPIEVSLKNVSTTGVADINIVGDKAEITGVKGSAVKRLTTRVTFEYKDAQGNIVERSFKVKVADPLATAIVLISAVLFITLVGLLAYLAYRSRIHLFGKIRVCEVVEGSVDAAGNFTRNPNGFAYQNPNACAATNAQQRVGIRGFAQNAPQQNGGAGLFGGVQNAPQQNVGAGLFGGVQNAPQQNGGAGLFGGVQNAPQQNGGAGLFGGVQNAPQQNVGAGLFGGGQNAAAQNNGFFGGATQNDEIELSNRFNEACNFGEKRIKKKSLEKVFDDFLSAYSEFMKRQLVGGSKLADELQKRFSFIRLALSKMQLNGTLGGKSGAKLVVKKDALQKKQIIMVAPRLANNKADLPYGEKGVVALEFIVITDDKSDVRKAIRVSAKLERS